LYGDPAQQVAKVRNFPFLGGAPPKIRASRPYGTGALGSARRQPLHASLFGQDKSDSHVPLNPDSIFALHYLEKMLKKCLHFFLFGHKKDIGADKKAENFKEQKTDKTTQEPVITAPDCSSFVVSIGSSRGEPAFSFKHRLSGDKLM
jgi:hypothetical protein